jgi:hypothetical protein
VGRTERSDEGAKIMPDGLIIAIVVATLLCITAFLLGSLVRNILRERRAGHVRKIWPNFALSITFCGLFLISWASQGLAEWGEFRSDQRAHGQPASAQEFVLQFGQSTLENWQSEFLQLFSFVVLAALMIHRGSAESKDSDDRMEGKIDEIIARLDRLDPDDAGT